MEVVRTTLTEAPQTLPLYIQTHKLDDRIVQLRLASVIALPAQSTSVYFSVSLGEYFSFH